MTDAATGVPLRGIEDLVALPDGSLLLSARDRWALESGEPEGIGAAGPSGLFHLRGDWAGELGIGDQRSLQAKNLTARILPVFRPHGIDAIAGNDGTIRIFAVNRAGGDEQSSTGIDVFDFREERLQHVTRIDDPRLCRANDVAAIDGRRALVTLDTAACDRIGNWRELVFGPPEGSVVRLTLPDPKDSGSLGEAQLTPVATGLRFANGIAIGDGSVWVAETRGQRLLRLPLATALEDGTEPETSPASAFARIPLPASPDNLTMTGAGDLLVTQHPSLLRLALHRAAWLRREGAGTRVDRLAIDESVEAEPRLEWLDPKGAMLSAGTVALEASDGLVVGSVTAAGLAWCPEPGQT